MRSEIAEWSAEHGTWADRRFFQFVVFDEAGRVTQLDQRGAEDSIYRTVFRYDAEGRLVEEAGGTSGKRATHTRFWTYDERGRIASITAVREDGAEGIRQQSIYDELGRRTDHVTFPPDFRVDAYGVDGAELGYGAPGARSQATRYDEAGRALESEFRDANGALIRRIILARDTEGRVVTEESQMASAFDIPRHPGMSDADVERMRALVATAFGSTRTTFEYDAGGRLMTRVHQTGLLGEDQTTYQYDERGNPIEHREVGVSREMSLEDDGSTRAKGDTRRIHDVRFTYVYDEKGNWTERVVSARFAEDTEFAPGNVESRAIDYW